MDIKQRLRQAIDDTHAIPPLEPDILQLCHDALDEIGRLEGPQGKVAASTRQIEALERIADKLESIDEFARLIFRRSLGEDS